MNNDMERYARWTLTAKKVDVDFTTDGWRCINLSEYDYNEIYSK